MSDVRRSSRWMVDSESAADELWRRIEQHVPDVVAKSRRGKGATVGWYASGLNERLLFLNSAGKGGETKFLNPHGGDGSKTVDVVPRRGLCLVFDHRLLHEGALLLKGVKYAVRTDVMFERRS